MNPDTDRVVQVLLPDHSDGVQRWFLARWRAHWGLWVHEWTGLPIIGEAQEWRERLTCGCERARMQKDKT